MASHNGRVFVSAFMMAILLGGSLPARGQSRQPESGMEPSEGYLPNPISFSVTLEPSHPSETSTGGIFALSGKGVSAVLSAPLIFEDGFETGDTSRWSATVPEPTALPSGAVMFFNTPVCPTGWSFLSAAQGRAVVGLWPGGALGGTVLTAMSNLSSQDHGHVVSGSIAVDPGGLHNHWWAYLFSSEKRWISYSVDYTHEPLITWDNGLDSEGSGTYPFAYPLGEDHPFITGLAGYHDHSLALSEVSEQTTAIVPYLQLLACMKD